ncbi:MAG: SUMF1/EgtB/PvdO family nonheme iron enzyme [Alphaproteobacteria bacterium]|nr:SUMF1/EgtB/PvdO family nonheme iron enzyme [Alphaproteobacteria bacterium]
MTDIFLSYSRNDRERVRHIAQALEAEGFDVWWDPEILPGESFSKVIDSKLKDSACIIAVWSDSSINSNWVQEEADDGMQRNTLIPVMIDQIDLPRGFKRLQTADLMDWQGDVNNANWQMILAQIRKLVSNRAAAEAAERQAAAQARANTQAKVTPRVGPAPVAKSRTEPPVKKGGGFPLLLVVGLLALVGAGVTGYLLMTRNGGGENAASVVASNNNAPVETPPVVARESSEAEDDQMAAVIAPDDIASAQTPVGPEQDTLDAAGADDDASSELTASEAVDEEAPTEVVEATPARAFTPGEAFRDCETCPEVMPFAAGAEFAMGAPEGEVSHEDAETPQIKIAIAKSFAIGVHEVTYDEWAACIADGGCGGYEPSDLGWGKKQRPVVNVSVEDARGYLAWLSEKTGANYRLPSEAEWEYAARAGSDSAFHTGDQITTGQANYNGQYPYNRAPKGLYRSKTTAVGSFAANAFGIHDMHGNVREWTQDCWRSSHSGAPEDGSAVGGACSSQVIKGGAWNVGAWRLRSAYRDGGEKTLRKYDTGFRVVLDL